MFLFNSPNWGKHEEAGFTYYRRFTPGYGNRMMEVAMQHNGAWRRFTVSCADFSMGIQRSKAMVRSIGQFGSLDAYRMGLIPVEAPPALTPSQEEEQEEITDSPAVYRYDWYTDENKIR